MKESFYERAPILQILSFKNHDRVNPLIYIAVFGFIILFLGLAIASLPAVIILICAFVIFALYGYFRSFL